MNEETHTPAEEIVQRDPMVGGPNKLFQTGMILLVASLVYYAIFARVRTPEHLILGLIILVLALLPALQWTRQRHTQIPVFAILSITILNTYALPLLNGHQNLAYYSTETITRAALAVILFQVTLILVHRALRVMPGRGDFYETEIINDSTRPWLLFGIVMVTIYTLIERFTTLIPYEALSVLRALFSGVGMICNFICMRDWGRGTLSAGTRFLVILLITFQVIVQFSSLLMVGGLSLMCLALIGYVAGSQRIPYILIALLLPILAILHNGKAETRAFYWSTNGRETTEQITLSGLPDFYYRWFENGLTPSRDPQGREGNELTARLLERSSLFHMLCLVIHYTPDRQPFLAGETYLDIPAQFVPRIIWPNKPPGHVSTSRLSIYYGLQREEDTRKTTIGFGFIPEAYANFGYAGIVGLAVCIGALFKWVEMRTAQSSLLTPGGILLILLTAWSFQTEFPMSLWITSFAQACVAVILLPMFLKKLFG